jgi:hypothetical protein
MDIITLENERVEHCCLIYIVTVKIFQRNAYVTIGGKRHKVYKTGKSNEPWTTNISLSLSERRKLPTSH